MPRFGGRRPKIKADDRLPRVRSEVQQSVKYRQHVGVAENWNTLIDAYEGKILDDDESFYRDRVVVNLMFATLNVMWPSISIKQPTISVLPRQPGFEDHAVLVEQGLSYLWRVQQVQPEMRAAIRDFLMLGMGWVKVGWDFEESPRPLDDREREDRFIADVQENEQQVIANGPSAALTDEEIWESVLRGTKLETVKDDVYVERVAPHDMFVNAEATSLRDARWIAHRSVRTLEEAKADKTYNQRVRATLTGETVLDPKITGVVREERDRYGDDIERVVVWEFWDLERREMMTWTDSSEEFLIKPRPFPYHVGHPFRLIRNYSVPGKFYAQGELEQLLPLVQEHSETRTQMLNQRRKYNRKYVADPKYLNEQARRQLESDVDNAIAYVDDSFRGNLSTDVVVPLAQTPMSADLYRMVDQTMTDINVVSGLSEYQRGQAPQTRQTATEAAMIQDATNSRQAEKLSQVETFIAEIAESMLGMMQQFMDSEKFVRVVGKNGEILPFNLTPDDIQGRYMFEIEAGSTQPTNETTRRTNAITMLNALAPFMGQIIDPAALIKHVLVEGFDVRQPEKLLAPQAVQQLAQMQQVLGAEGDQQGAAAPQPPENQGPAGVGAPNLDPASVLALQQNAQVVNGIPDSLTGQLQGQVGLEV